MPDGTFAMKYCKSCHRSDVRFPSKTAPRCTGCTNAHNGARAERLAILRPSTIAVDMDHEPSPRENPEHLAWVRTQPCAVHNHKCSKVPHAHHVRSAATAGTGMKPGPEWVVPLCSIHHAEFHNIGGETFQDRYGIDLRALALRLAATSPCIKREAKL